MKQINSIFSLPELYDDLLDEWTHETHIEERNRVLHHFQTKESHRPSPINDAKLMYQIISSAIVNMPPSKMAIRVAHRFQTKWEPVEDTEEEVIDLFV